jgi:tRNA modification GTPase
LVNALAGYQRSIVAATPGTTRDVVTTRLALDGWLIELVDTAGQRAEAEELEEQGIRRAQATASAADLCLWVLDGSVPPIWPMAPLAAAMYVVNKSDLPPAWDRSAAPQARQVSALTGAGLAELCTAVIARLVPDPPPLGAAVPFTPRLCEGITLAQRQLAAGNIEETCRILAALREAG